ncbi:hypothetical protein MCOR32_006195 [Pyricularia oryzae]|nr:hypothetical protein MCOR32_006195 [Pyricularia oryzae]KAI6496113.1 hypothetical protein MCOR13_007077 [Pyricularia oryzae]
MRGEITAIREHNKHRGAGKTIFQWPTEGGEKTKFIAWTVTPNPKEPTQVTPPRDPNKHEGRWDASRFTKVETSVPVVEEATGACGGGTAKRDLDGRSLCPLNPTPKVCNPVTGKGAVAKVTAGKGSVPDKRKSFSGRRVQGAVVKSGKGRTGTVLKNGTILHLQRVPQHLSTPPLGETAEYLAKSLLAASSSRLLAGSETKRGGKTGLLWIRREKGNGCACMKVRVSTPRGYVDKFR